jgi:DNA-binding CsgD family transcriptional regulator
LPSPLKSDRPIDLVIVRENVEGEYPTREGDLAEFNARWPGFHDIIGQAMPPAGAFALRITTEAGCERIARYAAGLARARREAGRPGKVSIVTKQNVLKRTDGIFKAVAERVLTLFSTGRRDRRATPFPTLTDRETEVLGLIAAGHNNRRIAAELFLSEKTVRNHISAIFAKLHVTDRAQAIVRAREAGLS